MDIIKVLKLDLLSVRPYLTIKNLIILTALGTFYGVLSKNSFTVLAIAQMFAMLFSGYPFLVGEESGIDPLYKLFGIKSKDVVIGRYLLAAIFVGVMLIVGVMLALIIAKIWPMENGRQGLLLATLVTGAVSLFIIFIEYPIYFKHGYKKGKTLAMIPFLIVGIAGLIGTFFGEQFKTVLHMVFMNKTVSAMVALVIWAFVLLLSFQLSKKFYSERDF